jgi:2-dehydropantoate 2-reductase
MSASGPSGNGNQTERVVIVGPGAIGCLYAALLGEGGVTVTLLDHRPERAELIARQGLRVVEAIRERMVPVACTADPAVVAEAGLVILLVKAYDTGPAVAAVAPYVQARAAVLTLQNGLGNYEVLSAYVPSGQVLAGSTTAGATLLGPGNIRIVSRGEIALGSPVGNRALASQAAATLARAGLYAVVEEDVLALLWRKVLANSAINPLTALTGRRNGELLEDQRLRRLLGAIAAETYAVGAAAGVDWGGIDPVGTVEDVCRRTAANRSSMLQDVEAGRRTEIEAINGCIAERARAIGIRAPGNEMLTALVERLRRLR